MSDIRSIPLSLPFADTLAADIFARYPDPLTLSSITLLLPSRRAARAMREAFLRVSGGKPLLLPAMRGIGDVEEDVLEMFSEQPLAEAVLPAISPMRRQLLLAGIIERWSASPISREQSMLMAYDLAAFLDETQRYELPLHNLRHIVPEELAEHWQVTLDLFDLLATEWPRTLKSLGRIDPITRRNALMAIQVKEWMNNPAQYPVIAAGTTGSTPATLRLLKAILTLPQGSIVLHGLDRSIPETLWESLEAHHPQYALKSLLEGLGVVREEVENIERAKREISSAPCPLPFALNTREALISAIMCPPGAVAQWQSLPEASLQSVAQVETPTIRQEAEVIALRLREALDTPGKRAALVTNDRELARRVASLMERWGIAIDDSAGVPLEHTPPLAFLKLVVEMVASHFAPVAMLAALKHPLATCGMDPGIFRAQVRALEVATLRGLRPEPGITGLRMALERQDNSTPELLEFLSSMEKITEDLCSLYQHKTVPPLTLLSAHIACAETLAGGAVLWDSAAGGQVYAWLETLREALNDIPPLFPQEYPGWFETLCLGAKFRPAYGLHPRLAILSPMEARLQRYDLMILGGMNEGSWPASRPNAWMNRQMRRDFGLPPEEFYTGLAARDFVECCSVPEVMFTRAQKSGGKPAIASPWLLRLEALLESRGWQDKLVSALPWLAWSEVLHLPDTITSLAPPQPKPPLSARPQQLSVTTIETWMRDPYGLYAKHILRLRKLDALDQDPESRDYGTLLHGIFEAFIKEIYPCHPERSEGSHAITGDPSASPQDDKNTWLALLLKLGAEKFREFDTRPAVHKLWWPRFERIAAWFVENEMGRNADIQNTIPECKGLMQWGDFTLTAKSDRVEMLRNGDVRIVDYKTGQPPNMTEVATGLAGQLTLTALIAEANGFEGVQGKEVSGIEYWRISATEPGARNAINTARTTLEQVKQDTREGFAALLAAFADENTAYLACPDAKKTPHYNDYAHLERIREWSITGEAE